MCGEGSNRFTGTITENTCTDTLHVNAYVSYASILRAFEWVVRFKEWLATFLFSNHLKDSISKWSQRTKRNNPIFIDRTFEKDLWWGKRLSEVDVCEYWCFHAAELSWTGPCLPVAAVRATTANYATESYTYMDKWREKGLFPLMSCLQCFFSYLRIEAVF